MGIHRSNKASRWLPRGLGLSLPSMGPPLLPLVLLLLHLGGAEQIYLPVGSDGVLGTIFPSAY